jgi:long-chain acyl-CoA synthetase
MFKPRLTIAVCLTAAVFALSTADAAEVAGVPIDEHARIGSADLLLNGAGVRSKLFFKVYVAALYAPKKTGAAAALLDMREPRRLTLHLMRDLDAETLIGALQEGLRQNLAPGELAKLKGDSDRFESLMRSIGNARKNDVIAIDFTADGTAVGFNGQPRGSVAGEAFGRALLKVWLGDKPVDTDLKQALLGG